MVTHLDIADMIREYFPADHKGTMIEVGAAHPTMISISYPLRSFGWTIISVEPNPEFIDAFKQMNLPVLEYAACAEDKGTTTFKISPNSVSCSALEVKYQGWMNWTDADYRTVEVQALKLDTILQKHHPDLESVDVLLIDTEGWELEVLDGFSLEKFNPKMVVLENFSSLPSYPQYMEKRGYKMVRKEVQDEFYTR